MLNLLVHRIFEERVKVSSDSIAVVSEEGSMSYGLLNARSNVLCYLLKDLGLEKGDRVGMMISPGIDMISSLLSIFKSGGIYVPISKEFSRSWLSQIIEECCPRILFVSESDVQDILDLLAELSLSIDYIISLDKGDSIRLLEKEEGVYLEKDLSESYSTENFLISQQGEDSNYIFYTSGSTGKPKGILGSHRGLGHFIDWEIKEFSLDETCRVSQLSQYTFDASLRDIFVALCSGGGLYIPSLATRRNMPKLIEWIERHELTLIHCVPSVLRMLMKELESFQGVCFSKLKHILMAGELLYHKDIMKWRSLVGDSVELVNLYGSTETTLVKSFYRVGSLSADPSEVLPVGKPISETVIAIINEKRLCKIGEIGEVYIKTAYWTKGYYTNEELSQEVFVQNPLVAEGKDIVYKTGDLGRYTRDFDIEILGRLDSQVKVNGIRLELNEVEQAVRKISGIDEVLITTHKDSQDQIGLVCYYTGALKSVESIRLSLSTSLNSHSIPNYYIHLEEFPYNLNGKVNKKALPLPQSLLLEDSHEEPVNEIEAKLVSIWQEVLLLKKVSTNVSFFELGGSSLRAIQMISRIYKEMNVSIELRDILSLSTIKAFGQKIALLKQEAYSEIEAIGAQEYYEVSYAQKGLWVIDQLDVTGVAYNMPGSYVIEGQLDQAAFEKSFDSLIDRHEILRTTFISFDGEPKQKIRNREQYSFRVDFQDLRQEQNALQIAKYYAIEDLSARFDLEAGPLLRAKLLQVEDHKYIFLFTLHHIISDGWSMQLLVNDLFTLYGAYEQGNSNPLAPLRIQYKDYSAWHNAKLSATEIKVHQSYWQQQFSGDLPVLEFPTDYSRSKDRTYRGDVYSFKISKEQTASLNALCKSQDCSLFMGLSSILNVMLSLYTGKKDIVIGTPITGRDHVNLEDQIGLYINTLALRSTIDYKESFISFLARTKEMIMGAYDHKIYPYELLINDLKTGKSLEGGNLFDVLLMHQSSVIQKVKESTGLRISNFRQEHQTSKLDLTFIFTDNNEGIDAAIEFNTDLFERETIHKLSDNLLFLLNSFLSRPDLLLLEASLFHKDANEDILDSFTKPANK